MEKIIAMLSLGVLMAGTTYAQTTAPQKERKQRTEQRGERVQKNKKTPEEKAARHTEMLTKKLDLNKSQQRKLQALNLKRAQEMQAMHANRSEASNRKAMRSERKESKARYEADLKDILNKKQYAQYEAHREEMKAKHAEKRDHHKGSRGERRQKQS
jgi:periplasmic protein CpxP/Spy